MRGKAAGADQGIRYPTPGRPRTMSEPPMKSAKIEEDSESSYTSEVQSSSDEVAATTEKLSKATLEPSVELPRGLQPARDAKTCGISTLSLVGEFVPRLENSQPCDLAEFEQYKDVETRSRPRGGVGRSSSPTNQHLQNNYHSGSLQARDNGETYE